MIRDREPALLLLGTPEQFGADLQGPGVPHGMTVIPISCQSEGAWRSTSNPSSRPSQLAIVGRSPMAHTLADLAAALGLATPRSSTPATSPATGWTPARSWWSRPRATATRRRSSRPCTAQPAFVGLVASRKRGEAVLGYLADRGRLPRRTRPGAGARRAGPRPHRPPRDRRLDPGRAGPAAGRRRTRTGRVDAGRHGTAPARRAGHGDRPGVRDDGERRRRQPPAGARRDDVLVLLRGLPRPVRGRSRAVPVRTDAIDQEA